MKVPCLRHALSCPVYKQAGHPLGQFGSRRARITCAPVSKLLYAHSFLAKPTCIKQRVEARSACVLCPAGREPSALTFRSRHNDEDLVHGLLKKQMEPFREYKKTPSPQWGRDCIRVDALMIPEIHQYSFEEFIVPMFNVGNFFRTALELEVAPPERSHYELNANGRVLFISCRHLDVLIRQFWQRMRSERNATLNKLLCEMLEWNMTFKLGC